MAQVRWRVSIISSLAFGYCASFSPASAQVIPDNTLPVNSQVTGCPVCWIDGGTVRGMNLFHSFEEFSVPTGGEAFFNNALDIETIFARVTGSKISDIDGLIWANGTVNLFLINPNGMIFGENARLDIGGSFIASTGNSFTFSDGSDFSATNPQAPPLLTINITPGLQTGTLPVGDITNRGNLAVESGQTLALSGNQVTSTGSLTAPGGMIALTSRGDMMTGFMRSLSYGGNGGIITLSASGNITTEYLNSFSSRGNGGDITITAGGNIFFTAIDSSSSSGNGGNITITADGNIVSTTSIDSRFTEQIDSFSSGGNGGDITITAGGNIVSSALIDVRSSRGNGGDIAITAGGNIVSREIKSSASLGNGGEVAITAGRDITTASVNASGADYGGDIALSAGGNISTASVNSSGTNYGGNITFRAGDNISTTVLDSSSFSGNGGDIALSAGDNIFTTSIDSSSFFGNGGAIRLTAGDDISTESLRSSPNSAIFGNFSTGYGGAIALTTTNGKITINPTSESDSPRIDASGSRGDNITLTSPAATFELENGLILSNAFQGSGGNLQINAASVVLTNTELATTTLGTGNAGHISILSDGFVSLDNSRLFTSLEAGGIGKGGDITIDAQAISLTNASFIDTATFGQGNAGNVLLQADDSILLNNNSAIFSITAGQGDGGNVTVKVGETVSLTNASNISTAVNSTAVGDGGDITVEARDLSLTEGSQLVTTTSGNGKAGDITVNTMEGVFISGIDSNSTPIPSRNIPITNPFALNEIEPNDSMPQAQKLDQFFLDNPDHANLNVEFSTRIPYVSIAGIGNTRIDEDYYSFEITTAGTRGIFDIDRTPQSLGAMRLHLFDSVGNRIASNTVASPSLGAGGSTRSDPYLRYVFNEPGIYFIQAWSGSSLIGREYTLQVSLDTPNVARSVNNGVLASGLFAQSDSIGEAGNITINTSKITVQDQSQVSALTSDRGQGGSVQINADDSVFLNNQGRVLTESTGTGASGNLTINTRQLTIENGSQLSAATRSSQGGDIRLQGLNVEVSNNSSIAASTQTGTAGNLTINAAESVDLNGQGTLSVEATKGGTAGNLSVDTRQVLVRDGGRITVSSSSGQAGNLTIQADSVWLNQGQLTAETGISSIEGGANINLQDLDVLWVTNESLISAQAFGNANGGNITIDTIFLLTLPPDGGNGSDIIAKADQGDGGNITISGQGIFGIQERPAIEGNRTNDIDASSQFGSPGNVTLNIPLDPSRGLTELPSNFVDPTGQIIQGCPAMGKNGGSRFVVTGRGGVPPTPDDVLTLDTVLDDLGTLVEDTQVQVQGKTERVQNQIYHQIIEAQGWVKTADGQVILVAEFPTATLSGNWNNPTNCSD